MAVMLQGCAAGTYSTRGDAAQPDRHWIGSYPYKAFVSDFELINHTNRQLKGDMLFPKSWVYSAAVISMPFDLVIDTILLPLDLAAWPFGWKRSDLYH